MNLLKIGEIRELMRLLDETGLSELRIEMDDMKLSLKKPEVLPTVSLSPPAASAVSPVSMEPAASSNPAPTVAASATSAVEADDASIHLIKSPMVGTFYRSPAPDAPSFVETGAKVTDKTVVCIVEAMKLMNEIEAEVSGELVEVLAENGQLVEYGQPLFKVKRS